MDVCGIIIKTLAEGTTPKNMVLKDENETNHAVERRPG